MTPEQTLDWLAQQHFDQCREERPIQDWIRKMKAQLPEQPKQNTVEAVKAVLKGIDKTEIESPDGWWETSAGAEFGAKKLKYVIGLLAQPEQDKERCVGCEACIDTACGRDECPKGWPKAAQPEQEPVVWMCHPFGDMECEFSDHQECENCIPLYTTLPQRTWVGLTDEDKKEYVAQDFGGNRLDAMDWAEKRLKEKNFEQQPNT